MSASKASASDYANKWKLGNIHNFTTFVCTAGLLSPYLTPEYRQLFSPGLLEYEVDEIYTSAIKWAAIACQRHRAFFTKDDSNECGVFRARLDLAKSGNFDEQRLSLAVTSAFSQFLGSTPFNTSVFAAREQLDNGKNSQDFVVNRICVKGTLQAAVIEFAVDRGKDGKEAQLFCYARSDTYSLPVDRCPCTLGIAFLNLKTNAPTFKVFGYYQCYGDVFHVVPLSPALEMDTTNLASLFFSVSAFAMAMDVDKLPFARTSTQDLPFPVGTGGVCEFGGVRVKVFSYLSFKGEEARFDIPSIEKRSPLYALQMLPGSKVFKVDADLQLLVYPNLHGDHAPHHTECVAACIDHLALAHENGILHVDLHLGNFVFNPNDRKLSRIIDWDYARPLADLGRYVPGWLSLPERHRDAVSLCAVKLDHEWYSLLATLRRFQPVPDAADTITAEWAAAVDDRPMPTSDNTTSLGRPLRALAMQVRAINAELQCVDGNNVVVTGSPVRSPGLVSIQERLKGMSLAGITRAH
jgi:hypothetical protein